MAGARTLCVRLLSLQACAPLLRGLAGLVDRQWEVLQTAREARGGARSRETPQPILHSPDVALLLQRTLDELSDAAGARLIFEHLSAPILGSLYADRRASSPEVRRQHSLGGSAGGGGGGESDELYPRLKSRWPREGSKDPMIVQLLNDVFVALHVALGERPLFYAVVRAALGALVFAVERVLLDGGARRYRPEDVPRLKEDVKIINRFFGGAGRLPKEEAAACCERLYGILALMRLPSPALVEEFDSADEWHRDELHTQHILGRILVLRDDADAKRFVETRRGALRELLKPRPRDADGLNLRSAAAPPAPRRRPPRRRRRPSRYFSRVGALL